MSAERNFYRNLFVAKLPRNLTDNDLMKIFAEHYPESAKIMLDAVTGKSKGFGFVLFPSEEAGKAAFDALDRQHVNAHGHSFSLRIFPSKHDGKAATEEKNALFIRNIPNTLSRVKVQEFLRSFGNLTYCSMRDDHHGGNVWVVYAEYDSVQGAANSLKSLHGKRFFRQSIPVIAKYADSDELKKERRKRREMNGQEPLHETVTPVGVTVIEGHTNNNINNINNNNKVYVPPVLPAADHFSLPSAHFTAPTPAAYHIHAAYGTGFAQGHNDPFADRGAMHHHPHHLHHHHPHQPPLHHPPQHHPYHSMPPPTLPTPLPTPPAPEPLIPDHTDYLDPFSVPVRTNTPELSFADYGISTPVSSHSRSGSMQYRHNPYAPVTPISSRSSASSIQMNASGTGSQFGAANMNRSNNNNNNHNPHHNNNASMHYSGSGYQSQSQSNFAGNSHFANRGNNAFLEHVGSLK